MKNLKVLIINVCLRPFKPEFLFPLGLSYIAGAIKQAGYDFEILDLDRYRKTDEEIEDFLRRKDFDIAAFGCIVTGYKIVKKLSQMVRNVKKEAVIIAGNSVADSIPRLLLEKTEVDIAVTGEGEITIVEVLDKFKNSESLKDVKGIWYKENGKIFSNPLREVIKDVNSIPFPPWDLFDMETYIQSLKALLVEPLPLPKEQIRPFLVNTARGCPFKCSFCYQVFQRFGYRHRSADSILSEIEELQRRYGINYISFNDELSFPTKAMLEEFVDKILSKNLKFFWGVICRADLLKSEDDLELLKKVKGAGCLGFGFALESANKDILKAMNKRLVPEDFARQKRILDKAGLDAWTALVFGYPQETKETIKETVDFCYDLDIYPSAGYLLPLPGTPMYDYVFEKGLARDEEGFLMSLGDRQDLWINLTQMPSNEFQAEVKKNLKRLADKLDLGFSEENLLKTTKQFAKHPQEETAGQLR